MSAIPVCNGLSPFGSLELEDRQSVHRPPGWRLRDGRKEITAISGTDIAALIAEAQLLPEQWQPDVSPLGQPWVVSYLKERPLPGLPEPCDTFTETVLDVPGALGPSQLIITRNVYTLDPASPEFGRVAVRLNGPRRGRKPSGSQPNGGKRKIRPALRELHPSRAMTMDLVRWIQKETHKRTFASVARQMGGCESSVADIFYDFAERVDQEFPRALPEYIGIDNKVEGKRHFTQITDLVKGRVVELFEGLSAAAVEAALSRFTGRDRVKLVTMDYAKGYASAVRRLLPNARVVADKRHVLDRIRKWMNTYRFKVETSHKQQAKKKGLDPDALAHSFYLMNKRRRQLSNGEKEILTGIFVLYPDLKEVYDAKEAWYDIFQRSGDGVEVAEEAIRAWLDRWVKGSNAPAVTKKAYASYARTIEKRLADIVAYFRPDAVLPQDPDDDKILPPSKRRATNAAVEALNGEIKRLYAECRGFGKRKNPEDWTKTFKRFRLRVLHWCGVRTWEECQMVLAGRHLARAATPRHSTPLVTALVALRIGDDLPDWLIDALNRKADQSYGVTDARR